MTLAEFNEDAQKKLLAVCDDAREAENILSIIYEDVLHIKRSEMQARMQSDLTLPDLTKLRSIVWRLQTNEPLQYVLGVADFFGLKFKVNQHVLIPRPETEELVDLVTKTIKAEFLGASTRILDIGTGSGCIAITLKKNLPAAEVLAVDKSEGAIAVAMENDAGLKAGVKFITADFLDEQSWESLGTFDVIVSNPPYITRDEYLSLMKRVRNFEPQTALIADGDDFFIFYHRIAEFGKKHLKPDGSVFVELNSAHADYIAAIFRRAGYRKTEIKKDLQGNERMLVAGRD